MEIAVGWIPEKRGESRDALERRKAGTGTAAERTGSLPVKTPDPDPQG